MSTIDFVILLAFWLDHNGLGLNGPDQNGINGTGSITLTNNYDTKYDTKFSNHKIWIETKRPAEI